MATIKNELLDALKERVEQDVDDEGHIVYYCDLDEDDVYTLAHELLTARGLEEGDAEYEAEIKKINASELIQQAETEEGQEAEEYAADREYLQSLPFWR